VSSKPGAAQFKLIRIQTVGANVNDNFGLDPRRPKCGTELLPELAPADLVLALGTTIVLIMVGVTFWGLHMALTQGLFASLVADTAPADLRGTAFGVFNFAGGIAMLVASVLAGGLWDAYGPAATFLAGGGLSAIALIGLIFARRWAPETSH